MRADIAEAVERDAIDTAECRAHGGVDRKQLLIRRRRLAVAEHDAVELAHQHKIEVDQRAAVVGYEDAGNGNAGVAQKTEDIDLLRHLPLQLGGVDLEDAAWRVSPRDLEDRADLAAAQLGDACHARAWRNPIDDRLSLIDRNRQPRLQLKRRIV
ncbi:hypothetical protein J2R80_005984 [Bradyrhizobium sp. USDA 4541]|nr:hypothetical protein [Bradyrhizobium sp. USDA 4541]